MECKGKIIRENGENIYFVKGRFDYFDKNNFSRLLKEYKKSVEENAKFYVGLYSDEILERTGHTRKLKGKVTNEDRIFLLESLDFVDGAFLINSLNSKIIETELKARLYEKMVKEDVHSRVSLDKKYDIGYASGAFSNLHKGHVEHLKEMKEQCKTVIVAANSDRLIREYKNKEATVDEESRRLILSHIKYVDMAIITDEYDKLKAVDKIRQLCGKQFDAIFVGSDWKGNDKWNDFKTKLSETGIDVVFTDRPENGISTTQIDRTK